MYHAIFSIGGEDLEPPPSMESFDLSGPLSAGSLALTLGSNASIHSCLVYEEQLFGAKERYLMYIFVPQVRVALARDILRAFLRPLGLLQCPVNAETRQVDVAMHGLRES